MMTIQRNYGYVPYEKNHLATNIHGYESTPMESPVHTQTTGFFWCAGWWFQSFWFSIIYGIILPIDELIFFKMVIAPPTSVYPFQISNGSRFWSTVIPRDEDGSTWQPVSQLFVGHIHGDTTWRKACASACTLPGIRKWILWILCDLGC